VELQVDLGFIGERPFVNNASFGAYATVVQSPAYRNDKAHTTSEMLPGLLVGYQGPRLVARAGNVTVEGPQAVLVSNNVYGMGDIAGLGRRARMDRGTLRVFGVTVASAVQAAGLLGGAHSRGLTSLAAREVIIDADAAQIPVGVDGEELVLNTPVRCTGGRSPCGSGCPATALGCPTPSRRSTGSACGRWP
jgi:diacylglycerol kinase family enzyme